MTSGVRRELILIRHAEASFTHAGGDRARPLTERGIAQAQSLARLLSRESLADRKASAIWFSPAQRCMLTAQTIRAQHASPVAFDEHAELYEAQAETLLALPREADPTIMRLIIVGHNPAHAIACEQLLQNTSQDVLTRARNNDAYNPASAYRFDISNTWQEFSPRFALFRNAWTQGDHCHLA